MKTYDLQDIRNVAFLGHKASGKTSIGECVLRAAGATTRLGVPGQGTSTLDYEAEENQRGMSTGVSVASVEWNGIKLNAIDTPGDANFLRDTEMSLLAADACICVVSGKDGVEPMTDRVFGWARARELPTAIVISKMDLESADFDRTLEDIRAHLAPDARAVHMPLRDGDKLVGLVDLLRHEAFRFSEKDDGGVQTREVPDDARTSVQNERDHLIEDIAANDEELMEKFFEESLTSEEIEAGFAAAFRARQITPVFFASGSLNRGVTSLLDAIRRFFPAPDQGAARTGMKDGELTDCPPIADGPAVCQVFKTIVDQHAGKISVLRVLSGRITGDSQLVNASGDGATKERLTHPSALLGKTLTPVSGASCGDIFAVAKLKDTHTGDTLSADGFQADRPALPPPLISRSVHAVDKAHEDRVVAGLQRLVEEDPGLSISRDEGTGEVLLSGTGQQHVEVAVERLQRKLSIECKIGLPRVPYQETFTRPVKGVEGKHKKQSGGHGQFAVVHMDFAPTERGSGYMFDDAVVGGTVPRSFIPSVDKGIVRAMARGILAGFPVVDVSARLFDGKHHPVDSSDMAFQVAASKAFKSAAEDAKPVLLEPIMNVEIRVPEENMGDVISDVAGRRGRIVGSEPAGKYIVIRTLIPMAEVQTYEGSLRSITQGRGSFTLSRSHMEPVPQTIQDRIVEASGFEHTEEDD